MFYVYTYHHQDGTPYYVGKGKRRRAYAPHSGLPDPHSIDFPAKELSEADALQIEMLLIFRWKRTVDGGTLMNKSLGGKVPRGFTFTEEGRKNQSEAHKNSEKVRLHIQKVASINRGRKRSPEVVERIHAKQRGIKQTQEQVEKNRKAHTGIPCTDAARIKISNALKGRKRGPMSLEHRAKVSAAKKGSIPWNKRVAA